MRIYDDHSKNKSIMDSLQVYLLIFLIHGLRKHHKRRVIQPKLINFLIQCKKILNFY